MAELRMRRIVTKVRTLRTGETVGGICFTRGSLAQLLRNRFFIGEITFRGEVLKGEQPAILDRALFDAVQAKLDRQTNNRNTKRMQSEAPLIGRIFDDRGNRMCPSHARKGNNKYRYYLSSALLHGAPDRAGSVRRVPATEIEALVAQTVRNHIKPTEPIDDRSLVDVHVARVEVQPDRLVIRLAKGEKAKPNGNRATADRILQVPWQKISATRRREILLPDRVPAEQVRPMRSETRAKLVASVARGRRWLDETDKGQSGERGDNCKTGGMQCPKGQHDNLTSLPRARSRQGRDRRQTAPWHRHHSAHRLAS